MYQGNKRRKFWRFLILLVKNVICPAFCTSIYEPVCGSNNVTYSNLCKLRFADCESEDDEKITLKHKGKCESGTKLHALIF